MGWEFGGRFWERRWWTRAFTRSGSFCCSSSSSIVAAGESDETVSF